MIISTFVSFFNFTTNLVVSAITTTRLVVVASAWGIISVSATAFLNFVVASEMALEVANWRRCMDVEMTMAASMSNVAASTEIIAVVVIGWICGSSIVRLGELRHVFVFVFVVVVVVVGNNARIVVGLRCGVEVQNNFSFS